MKNRPYFIFSPFLFALLPALSLWAKNIQELSITSALLLMLLLLAFAGFLFLVARLVFKTWEKASLVTSAAILLLFSFGYVYDGLIAAGVDFMSYAYLLAIWTVAIVVVALFLFLTNRDLHRQNNALFITAVISTLFPLVSLLGAFLLSQPADKKPVEVNGEITVTLPSQLPDVYYIILDQYASNWTLENFYGYNNADFTDFLKEKGFVVDEKSLSNYAVTAFTLRSALNMEYLDNLSASDPDTQIKNHRAGRLFKKLGYTYIHFGSGWEITAYNPYADNNVNKGSLTESLTAIYAKTALYPVAYAVGLDSWITRRVQWKRILYQIKELQKVKDMPEPTFTLVHLGVPHAPFVFNRDGSIREEDPIPPEGWIHDPVAYLDQLVFVNEKVKETVEAIMEGPGAPPVIIIQSDHGSKSFSVEGISFVDMISDTTLQNHFRNFSAYYLPNGGSEDLYEGMTPVNVFRTVFDEYFGANLGLLSDIHYMSINEDDKNFIVVTPRVAY